MSSYRRFIAYVYRFQDGKKGGNCGFVKVEARGNIGTFYLRLQGLKLAGAYKILTFVRKGDTYDFIPVAEGMVSKGLLHQRVDTDRMHVGGSAYTLEQCAGLLCINGKDEYYATCWDKVGTVPASGWEMESEPENLVEQDVEEPIDVIDESVEEESEVLQEQSTEQQTKTFEEVWAYMQETFPAFDPFADGGVVEGIKISPGDIPYLQEQKCALGTNQFLLHGYRNYKHLLLGRIEGQNCYVLGVPGVFDAQEQFMAKMFGFCHFKPIHSCKNRNNQFGYWMRHIRP